MAVFAINPHNWGVIKANEGRRKKSFFSLLFCYLPLRRNGTFESSGAFPEFSLPGKNQPHTPPSGHNNSVIKRLLTGEEGKVQRYKDNENRPRSPALLKWKPVVPTGRRGASWGKENRAGNFILFCARYRGTTGKVHNLGVGCSNCLFRFVGSSKFNFWWTFILLC